MKPFYLILLLAMNFFWAGVYSAYKVLVQHGLSPGGIVTLRFGLAGLCLALIWPWLPGPAPRGKHLLVTGLMGLMLYVAGQRLQVLGNHLGTAGNSSVLMAVEPLLTSVAAAIFLREPIGPRRLGGFALGLLGVALLNGVWRPDFHWTGLTASLIFISSFICEAGYSVLGKPIVQRASVMKMLAISLWTGTLANLLLDGRHTLAGAAALPPGAWGLLVLLAVLCTVVGYSVWFIVIRQCPVNLAALTVFSQAVFGVPIAAFWLGEQVHWGHLFGSLTIVLGLALGFSRQLKPNPPASGPAPAAD
ncbi:MAG TPA: DMT family transporter [Candidatus Paceibacterota bacterium]|nr:DMT family transporter [Candidatus Paceibacterota bacterium]